MHGPLFTPFGTQHLAAVIATVLAAIALPICARRYLPAHARLYLLRGFALAISAGVITWRLYLALVGQFDWRTDLPLNFCNLAGLLVPVLMWTPNRKVHEFLYYMVLAGTLQAILTPDLEQAFPHFGYFAYWIVHSGLVVYVILVTATMRLVPSLKGILRTFVWLNVYAAAIYGFNAVLGTNYMYMTHKPPTPTLLDVFGPWPWYILVCEGAALVLFLLSYLPVARMGRAATHTHA